MASSVKVIEASKEKRAISALAMSPRGDKFASGSLDQRVKLWQFPSGEFDSSFARFQLPVRALAFSSTGSILAAAGDEGTIKLIQVDTCTVTFALTAKAHRGPIISLSFDPKNELFASADTDGVVVIWAWDPDTDWTVRNDDTHRCPASDPTELQRMAIAWQPDSGNYLAAPDENHEVYLLDRDMAQILKDERLKGAHNADIAVLAWSPNGRYIASAAADGQVIVWDTVNRQDVGCQKVSVPVCGLDWKPNGNALAMIGIDGKMAVWCSPVPDHMPSPFEGAQKSAGIDRKIVYDFHDDPDVRTDEAGHEEPLEDASELKDDTENGEDVEEFDESDSDKVEFRRSASRNKVNARRGLSMGQQALDAISDDERELHKDRKVHRSKDSFREFRKEIVTHADTGTPMQPAFQPGATDSIPGKRHFLAYNLMGCITTKQEDGHSHIETDFHDANIGYRVPPMTDYYGFTMAALGDKGSAFANPKKGDKSPSTFLYRPFNSWAANSEWSMRFSGEEEVRSVAVGRRWAAAATSLHLLRIFSDSGIQRHVLSLGGPVVAMAGHEHLLAVATHAAAPLPCGDQVLEFATYDVYEQRKVSSGRLMLSPRANLTWLGFSEGANLCTYDSQGVLRSFSLDYGGSWIPIFSSATERKDSEESHWMVGLNEKQVFVITCKLPEMQPQVLPRPVHTIVAPSAPLAHSDLGADPLEKELVWKSSLLSQYRARADEASAEGREDEEEEEKILAGEAELDRCLLRLIAAACKAEKLVRALDLAAMLSLHRSLEGAVKLANAMRLPPLAERLNLLLEEKLREEEGQNVSRNWPSTSGKRQVSPPSDMAEPLHPTPDLPRFKAPRNPDQEDGASPSSAARSGAARGAPGGRLEGERRNEGLRPPKPQQQQQQQASLPSRVERTVSALPGLERRSEGQETGAVPAAMASNPFAKAGKLFAKGGTSSEAASTGESFMGSLKKLQEGQEADGLKRKGAVEAKSLFQRLPKMAKAK